MNSALPGYPGIGWLLAYAALVAVCAVTVLVRREPTLVRGRTVFLFTVAYVAVACLAVYWRAGALPAPLWIAGLVALAVTGVVAPWWFVLGGPGSAVVEAIEVCFGRVCARYERVNDGFVMAVPGGSLHVRLRSISDGRFTLLSFRARPLHRKSDLFQRLLAKQYRGVLPTVTIRTR